MGDGHRGKMILPRCESVPPGFAPKIIGLGGEGMVQKGYGGAAIP